MGVGRPWWDHCGRLNHSLCSGLIIAATDEASQQDECWLGSVQEQEMSVFTLLDSTVWSRKKLLLRFS